MTKNFRGPSAKALKIARKACQLAIANSGVKRISTDETIVDLVAFSIDALVAEATAELQAKLTEKPKVSGKEACGTCMGYGTYELLDTVADDLEGPLPGYITVECERCSGTGKRAKK